MWREGRLRMKGWLRSMEERMRMEGMRKMYGMLHMEIRLKMREG
jgi:hypothetical protein